MIFISNNCLDGFLEKRIRTKYFSFTPNLSMTKRDFFTLMQHIYDEDLLDDFTLTRRENFRWGKTLLWNMPVITLKCGVRLNGVHYCDYTDDYVLYIFNARCKRFLENRNRERIIFCFTNRRRKHYDVVLEEDILKFDQTPVCNLISKYIITKEDIEGVESTYQICVEHPSTPSVENEKIFKAIIENEPDVSL